MFQIYLLHNLSSALTWRYLQVLLKRCLLLSRMSYSMEYPFGQLGSAILAVFFPDFLPSLLFFGGGCLKRKPQGCASRLCLAIAKTLMYYQHCFSHNTTCRHITILFLYHQIGKLVDSGYTLLVDL